MAKICPITKKVPSSPAVIANALEPRKAIQSDRKSQENANMQKKGFLFQN